MRRRGSRPALRLIGLLAVFSLLYLTVAVRLVQLQVVQAEPLVALAEQQRVREIELPATRGSILDRNQEPLAFSTEARAIYANPELLAEDAVDTHLLAKQIGPIIGKPVGAIRDLLDQADRGFVYLGRRQTPQIAEELMELRLPYIGTLRETMRSYPSDDTAGQVLGFVDVDSNGLSGMESMYDDLLAGTPGYRIIERDPQGRPIPQGRSAEVDPVPGSHLVLTLERDLQFTVEAALRRGVRATRATRGTAVVLDTRTGEVLAMANHPPLNPNDFGDAEQWQMRNRVVTDAYEPGSVFKVVTAAAAIQERIVSPHTTLTVPYTIEVGGRTFREYAYHPTERMTYGRVIAQSSNVGTIKVAHRVGKTGLVKMMRRFGIGRAADVRFPGESSGLLLDPAEWSATSLATIPIGQGVAVTPLQMASVYATIANDGVRLTPRLVAGTIDPAGVFAPAAPPKAKQVIDPFTAAQVRSMLIGVVEEGTGATAQIPGYLVGGKTGTARVPRPDGLGYSGRVITTFAGMAPAEDPRLVVLVQLEDPTPRLASRTAAPVFKDVMRSALASMGIAPTLRPSGATTPRAVRSPPAPTVGREAERVTEGLPTP